MPFSMIFSILLIIFFIAAAFIAIRYFLNIQKCTQIAGFVDDFKNEINRAWNSQSSSYTYTSSLPSNIDYVCFINLTKNIHDADPDWKDVYNDVKFTRSKEEPNFVIYPLESACDLGLIKLRHIRMPDRNPYCIVPEKGKISIKLEKTFEDPLVNIE